MTKRKNYFRINDPKLKQVFTWVYAALFAVAALVFAIIIAELMSLHFADDGFELSFLFPGLNPFVNTLFGVFIILFIVFLTIVIYIYATNKENDRTTKQKIEAESPLLGVAKEHQAQIIGILKSVAMPAPNKQTINHARTAKFIQALVVLLLIDSNRDSKQLMAWIESVTTYSAGETRVFNQALRAVKVDDREFERLKEQIAQIIAK